MIDFSLLKEEERDQYWSDNFKYEHLLIVKK